MAPLNYTLLKAALVIGNWWIMKTNVTLPYGYVERSVWNAALPKHIIPDDHRPVSKVIIAHTNTDPCDTGDYPDVCDKMVRSIQEMYLNRSNFIDIGYNFLIGGRGKVYEGLGWYANGNHTPGYNNNSRVIAFIGRFNDERKEEPEPEQIIAVKELIAQGRKLGMIKRNYLVYGQRSLMKTDSPGDVIFNIIKDWPKFSDNVKN